MAAGTFGEDAWEGAGDGRVADGDDSTMGMEVGEGAEKTPKNVGEGWCGKFKLEVSAW